MRVVGCDGWRIDGELRKSVGPKVGEIHSSPCARKSGSVIYSKGEQG